MDASWQGAPCTWQQQLRSTCTCSAFSQRNPLPVHAVPVGVRVPLHSRAAALPGLLAGATWAVGSAAAMLADVTLGLAIAYPSMQAGLCIAGLWGMLLYRELTALVDSTHARAL